MKINNKGLSLVELLVVVAILGIALGAIMVTYTGSLRVFTNVKSLSDPIETKTPSIELIARYFDRWGVGVIAKTHRSNCTVCPAHPMSMTITTGSPCDEVTFYGNLHGYGFVRAVVGTANDAAKLISCRLDMTYTSDKKSNCYTLWRDNTPLNDYNVTDNNRPILLGIRYLSQNNADCSNVISSTSHTATMDDEMSPYEGTIWKTVKPGDVIHRAAHRIKLYCANNTNDGNRTWLYSDLEDFYGVCNENELSRPIAPVDSFKVVGLPSGCNFSAGECTAVRVTVVFRSQSPDYSGQLKTYEVTRIFGR